MSSRLIQILVSIFSVWLFTNIGFATEAAPDSSPSWVSHVSSPGPDNPASGVSLFDQLFLKKNQGKKEYAIPYPFEALMADLEKRIDNGKQASVPHALIPIGRSLQREAAAPDYFHFPRSVITLAGEPVIASGQSASVLNYRLFIGYQEKAKQLEIISYNESAGRFEFQIANNYQLDTTPRVYQASRALCMSCHQNAGPIFAASPWSESNFNPEVALKLTTTRPDKFESLISTMSQGAEAIDLATSRANYLAVAQLIWQSGCEGDSSRLSKFRCRAAILQALLQYRLSGDIAFDTESPVYRSDYVSNLRNNWDTHWPAGLLLASAQIPDTEPFRPALSDASHNPLSLRPPHAFWQKPEEIFSRGVIYRISGFLTQADIQRLDQHLMNLASSGKIESKTYQTICNINGNPTSLSVTAYRFDCANQSSPQSIRAAIEIDYQNNSIVALRVSSLSLPGSSLIWQPVTSKFKIFDTGSDRRLNAKLSGSSGMLSARIQNGNRISEMTLSWPQNSVNGGPPQSLQMELVVSYGYKVLQDAIEQMVSEAMTGRSQALTSKPFRQQAIIGDLVKHLGMEALKWCCEFEKPD